MNHLSSFCASSFKNFSSTCHLLSNYPSLLCNPFLHPSVSISIQPSMCVNRSNHSLVYSPTTVSVSLYLSHPSNNSCMNCNQPSNPHKLPSVHLIFPSNHSFFHSSISCLLFDITSACCPFFTRLVVQSPGSSLSKIS